MVVDVMGDANSKDIRSRARDMHQQVGAIRDTLMQLGLLRKKGHLTKCRCSKRLTRIYILQFQRTVTKYLPQYRTHEQLILLLPCSTDYTIATTYRLLRSLGRRCQPILHFLSFD